MFEFNQNKLDESFSTFEIELVTLLLFLEISNKKEINFSYIKTIKLINSN
jgi:hypothetical protein